MMFITRGAIDALWAYEPGMVSGNLRLLKNIQFSATTSGLFQRHFTHLGPITLQDVTVTKPDALT